jgi:predicted RecB family nuclease
LFKLKSIDAGKGLTQLPPASSFDVCFDIEGHPLYEGGLEYLWGASCYAPDSTTLFKDWWAHTPEQERIAFENFIDWVYQRWQVDKTLHVYHYAQYEITALRKLSERYDTRNDEVTELLTNSVFIDLYRIVVDSFAVGVPSYSIKEIEYLYRDGRTTSVANGGDSVVAYECWREQDGVERWCHQDNGYSA